jgi:D-alanine-D-alanine ligase
MQRTMSKPPARAPQRVLAIYNTDYDAELIATTGADVSAVEAAARAVASGIAEAGYQAELVGIDGHDLGPLLDRLRRDPPDLVFNLCESLCGDARNELVLPALLDMLGVPYTGPGPLTLGMCLHKERAKQVLAARGVPTPPYLLLRGEADLKASELAELDFPYFLKPAHEDASVGIEASNVVRDAEALRRRAAEMLERHRQPVVAERYIDGREVNVTLLGNGDALRVLPLHEIDFSQMPAGRPHIISYAAKWDESHDEYAGTLPVPLRGADPELEEAITEAAQAAFSALELRDFGRVDIRVDGQGRPWVIDVNPNCDLSPDAGVARAAARAGARYPQLVGEVCEIAWRRYVGACTAAGAG